MKLLYTLSFSLVFCISSLAQPNYSVRTYRVQEGQKVNRYNRAAKDFIKAGRYNEAVLNASYALRIAEKKNQISTAQNTLTKAMTELLFGTRIE